MSLFDSDLFQDLFLPENINSSFNPSTLSDDMNDFLFESTHNPPKREIKFILTKEDTSKISFLKKKINYGIGDCTLSPSNGGRWSNEEQQRFAEAVLLHGNEWKKIQNHVDTRNLTQVRSHAQKFLMKLKETSFFKSLNFTIFYLRLEDNKNVFKVELPYKASNEEVFRIIEKLKVFSVQGYPYLLNMAHNDVVIKDKNMDELLKLAKIYQKTNREML